MPVIIGVAYVGIMLFNNLSLDWAVQRAVRQVTLNHAITTAQVRTTINDYLNSVGLANANVEYGVVTSNAVQTGSIAANYTQTYTLPFVSTFTITYASTASVPIGS